MKTSREIKDFTVGDLRETRNSYIIDDIENEVNTSNMEASNYWKWIIFFYQMCFVSCLLASLVFWTTVIFFNENYDVTGEHDFAILVSLHTVPSLLMLIEYPFNMIPWDWHFLPFDLFMLLIYLGDTVLFQVFQVGPVYNGMDWARNAPMASGVFLGICGVMILIFSAMMLIT